MSYKCAGGGVGLTPFFLVALLQTHACNVGGHTHTHTHTRIACRAEHSTTCTLFYKPGKVLSVSKSLRIKRILISKFGLTDFFLIKL